MPDIVLPEWLRVAGFCLLIVLARSVDVTLGTLRVVCIVRNIRWAAFSIGFFESFIWIMVIARIAGNLNQPLYMVSFALGFALGNYIGLTVEHWLAIGEQAIRVFTDHSVDVASALRQIGLGVTKFRGEGKDGEVDLLVTTMPRSMISQALALIKQTDPDAFYFVDEVTRSSHSRPKGVKKPWFWLRQPRRK